MSEVIKQCWLTLHFNTGSVFQRPQNTTFLRFPTSAGIRFYPLTSSGGFLFFCKSKLMLFSSPNLGITCCHFLRDAVCFKLQKQLSHVEETALRGLPCPHSLSFGRSVSSQEVSVQTSLCKTTVRLYLKGGRLNSHHPTRQLT